MTKLTICDNAKRKPITALKPGTFFVLHKDSNLKDVICIKIDNDKRFFDFDDCCIHSYGDVDCTTLALLCKSVDVYVKNDQTDHYYENFSLHYPMTLNQCRVTISDLSLTIGDFFASIHHPINAVDELICYSNHFYLKVSGNEYFDLNDCSIHLIDEDDKDKCMIKITNIEILVSI